MRIVIASVAATSMLVVDCVYAHPHWVPAAAWVMFATTMFLTFRSDK